VSLGWPRAHFRVTDSTNDRARLLAERGAPHGTLVTAEAQTAGRGRQGRNWLAPAGKALLCSVILRPPPRLAPLAAGVAVAEVVEAATRAGAAEVKWPNDVLLEGRKVAGILVEGRPQQGWAVLGVGVNVAVSADQLPAELRATAGGLGLTAADVEPILAAVLTGLERWLCSPREQVLETLRARDALRGRQVRWAGGAGRADGIDGCGRLRVITDGGVELLDAGEVHLLR
jgi:BirA family biotin operon repressor/biotin-[acetyl-CoA-carboxylase] ligase